MAFLIIFLCVIAIALAYVASRPPVFTVTRSAAMTAAPAAVFAQVNDFHNWNAWSPWAKMDPACKNTFEGPPAGNGAVFRWEGNRQVGAGNMTITESQPGARILIRLEFLKPFKGVNATEFTFRPDGGQTLVTWTMTGKNGFAAKVISLFMDCEKMVGGQFDQGLAAIRSIVEAKA